MHQYIFVNIEHGKDQIKCNQCLSQDYGTVNTVNIPLSLPWEITVYSSCLI